MKRFGCFFAFSLGIIWQTYSQKIEINLGPDEIAANEYFTITVEIRNDKIRTYEGFPEIEGLKKIGISSSSSMRVENGQVTSTQSVSQNYVPAGEGVFTIPPFTLMINDNKISSPGKKVKVGPATQHRRYDPYVFDPFEDLFKEKEPTEFVEMKDDAFLSLNIDKSEVYVGEGFTATLAFYITEENDAQLDFDDAPRQIAELVKEIKPDNCWEENFNIERISGEEVVVNKKRALEFKIYQATFYPFNDRPVKFPSVALRMIKYLQAKRPSLFSSNRKEDYKTYHSSPRTVKVKPLPAHPLRENVSVGRYTLSEEISSKQLSTGESFTYNFTISGEGNISALTEPTVNNSDNFDFYSPNIERRVSRGNNKLKGSQSFEYYIIPNEPGQYDMGDYLSWVYFDPVAERYDTLRPAFTLNVTGDSKKNEFISSSDLGTFYDLIETEDNTIINSRWNAKIQLATNIFLGLMLFVSAFFIFKK